MEIGVARRGQAFPESADVWGEENRGDGYGGGFLETFGVDWPSISLEKTMYGT